MLCKLFMGRVSKSNQIISNQIVEEATSTISAFFKAAAYINGVTPLGPGVEGSAPPSKRASTHVGWFCLTCRGCIKRVSNTHLNR